MKEDVGMSKPKKHANKVGKGYMEVILGYIHITYRHTYIQVTYTHTYLRTYIYIWMYYIYLCTYAYICNLYDQLNFNLQLY